MAKADLRSQVGRLRDRLSYVLLYAPDFPAEDRTTLSQEFKHLLADVHQLWSRVQDASRRKWLDLLAAELVEARQCFERGDSRGACGLIQSAEERLADWFSNTRSRPTFVVDPDGKARKA